MTNQPTPLTGCKDLDRVIEGVYNPEPEAALNDAESSLTAIDELRRKLCAPPPTPPKSRWRFW